MSYGFRFAEKAGLARKIGRTDIARVSQNLYGRAESRSYRGIWRAVLR